MASKTEVVDLIRLAQDWILYFADSLDSVEQSASGTPEDWAARDMLAHVGYWNRHLAERFAESRRGSSIRRVDDLDEANRVIFNRYREKHWQEFVDLLCKGYSDLRDQVERFTEEELNNPQLYAWTNGKPVWQRIISTAYFHPLSHLAWVYLKRDDKDGAKRMCEDEFRRALMLDDSPSWQGTVTYNLACHYALMGSKETALEKLDRSLQLYPELVPWSQLDPDLATLQNEPDFLAIIEKVNLRLST